MTKTKSMLSPIEKNRIRIYFYIASILTIVLMTSFLLFQYSRSLNREYKNKTEQLSSGIIEEKQKFIQNAVDQVIYLIQSERDLANEEYSSQGLPKEQIDAIAIRRISKLIRDMRLIDDGYIWVNRIVNYQGGDNYAIRQIHPNLPETEGKQLSTNTTDIKGNRPYQEELDGINKNGEIFFDYYFKKLNSEKISHKMSYAKLYKPFDWVVATGIYLDDLDQLIASEARKMEETYKSNLFTSLFITALGLLLTSNILLFFDKKISSLIGSYQKDITGFTEKLIKEKEKTQSALDKLGEAIKAANIGLWDWDLTTNEVHYSKEWKSLIGYEDHEISDDYKEWKSRVHPDDLGDAVEKIRETIKNVQKDLELEFRFRHKNGSYLWILAHATVISDQDGKPVRMIGSHIDITEKKNFQQAQLRTGQLSALGEVAAGVAHEINNPINGVINYAQLLISRNNENDQSNQILERIIREGNRIATIVKNLLNFATKDRSELSSLDLVDIVTEPLNLQAQLLKSEGIHVELSVPSNLPKIYGNRVQLEQVVLNLLSNARHALHKKYPQPCNEKCIVIEATPSHDNNGGCVQLSIKDFGCGIPKDHLEKIFNPFFTTKEAGVGTGLGMSISHDILEKHGAAISIDSMVNKYTTVKITFPAKFQETSN